MKVPMLTGDRIKKCHLLVAGGGGVEDFAASELFTRIIANSSEHSKFEQAEKAVRLSNGHICTLPKVELYEEGSVAIVSRQIVEKACSLCHKPFEVPAWKAARVTLCGSCRTNKKNKRGSIETFSRRSRRRLMFLANTVKADVKPLFATATFADSYTGFEDPAAWKEALRVFAARFTRHYKKGSLLWRLEIVDRKSGEWQGRPLPHFHFIIFGASLLEFRSWFAKAWHEVAGEGDPKHLAVTAHYKSVSVMESKRQLVGYISKSVGRVLAGEVAKELQAKGLSVGRWWGVVQRSVFAFYQAIKKVLNISEKAAVELIRCFRKYARIKGRSLSSFCCFIDGAWLKERLPDLLALADWIN